MENFKVGDRVEVLREDGAGVYQEGDKGTVIKVNDYGSIAVKMDNSGGHSCLGLCKNGYGWNWHGLNLKLVEPSSNKSIHITVKDNTVHAVYKNGDDIIKRSEAKCHPDDEFDFEIGAKLAFERLGFVDGEDMNHNKEEMVFDKYKFIEDVGAVEYKLEGTKYWVDKCHGLTKEEMNKLEYVTADNWMVKESEWCE